MNPEYIKNIAQLWQDVQEGEKKKLDPVDDKANDKKFVNRKDKDIDNDGDVDSSDEFLHKRRKAIDNEIDGGKKPAKESCGDDDKKMKKESDEEMTPCPDCKGSMDNHEADCPKADTDKKEVEEGKVKDQMVADSEKMSKKDFIKKYGKEMADDLYEAKEYSYTVVHAKKGKVVVTAPTSYDAAQKAAKQWKLKSTGGVDAYLMKESVELDEAMGKLNSKGEIEMTAKNYAKVHKDFKTKMQGVPFAMQIDPKTGGSALFPVKIIKESNIVTHADHGYGEILQRTDEGVDVMFEHGVEMGMSEATLTFLETVGATTLAKKATQVSGGGAKHGETQSKGAKDFADKHDKNDPKLAADDSVGHEDATKAGRAVKSQSGTRGNEPRIGDKTIVNPVKGAVTKTTGKE